MARHIPLKGECPLAIRSGGPGLQTPSACMHDDNNHMRTWIRIADTHAWQRFTWRAHSGGNRGDELVKEQRQQPELLGTNLLLHFSKDLAYHPNVASIAREENW